MKHLIYWQTTSIRCNSQKFSRLGKLVSGMCAYQPEITPRRETQLTTEEPYVYYPIFSDSCQIK
jgi:hypothetical protein